METQQTKAGIVQQNRTQNADVIDDDFINSLQFTLDGIDNRSGDVSPAIQAIQQQKPQNQSKIPINYSRKLKEMKEKLSALDAFRTNEEIEKLFIQASTKGGTEFLKQVSELNINLLAIRRNQETMISELSKPINDQNPITTASVAGAFGREEEILGDILMLKKSLMQLEQRFSGLNPQQQPTVGNSQEIRAIGDTVESLKSSIFMLNKKIDLNSQEERISRIENKLKELISYLHRLSEMLSTQSQQGQAIIKKD